MRVFRPCSASAPAGRAPRRGAAEPSALVSALVAIACAASISAGAQTVAALTALAIPAWIGAIVLSGLLYRHDGPWKDEWEHWEEDDDDDPRGASAGLIILVGRRLGCIVGAHGAVVLNVLVVFQCRGLTGEKFL